MSSIPRVFVSAESITDNRVVITGSDAGHLTRVLRLRVGDKIVVCDMQRTEYTGTIACRDSETVTVELSEEKTSFAEPPFHITLYQGMPKGDKLETIVQKAVELGVGEIIPVMCERSVSKPDAKKFGNRLVRLNKIALAAGAQSGRGVVPTVGMPVSFAAALQNMKNLDLSFVCYEGEGTVPIQKLLGTPRPESIGFLIGPEGGLSIGEIQLCDSLSIPKVGLGNRILRTETASGFVLAAISVLLENPV